MSEIKKIKKPLFQRFLDGVEVAGNKLPNPAILFAILAIIVMIISHIAYKMGASVIMPAYGNMAEKSVEAFSLLSAEGVAWMFTNVVKNFVGFAPLGIILVVMLGVGVAENVGLFSALLRKTMLGASKKRVTIYVITVALISNVASDVGYVVVIPLGAAIFYAVGRHPLAGLAAAFFGVSGGFAANVILSTSDFLLSGITEQVVGYEILATSNWYFLGASFFMLIALGYYITEKIIVPRLGEYKAGADAEIDTNIAEPISAEERKGLKYAGWYFLGMVVLLLALILPPGSPMRNPETGSLLQGAPFMKALVPIIMLLFLAPAIGYGIAVKKIKDSKDVVTAMTKSLQTMGSYMVLAFFAAQFIEYFKVSHLGDILAVNGADFLVNIGFTGIPLILSFIVLTAFLNIFIGSAAAKWAMMAPIFVPMFMGLGYDPTFTQVAYRIGASCTNIITPLLPYFALILVFAQKYDKKASIGTIISLMLPYSLLALLVWSAFLVIWYFTGLPIGLGGQIFLPEILSPEVISVCTDTIVTPVLPEIIP
ncbi:MAG: AbgT family transporter [Bacteroidales bacterium]|jgi:aminobenzoyl-glutamate transport protein|nr:AbgT family transporter [Bacteroidales bacterium]